MVRIESGPKLLDLKERMLLQEPSIASASLPATRRHNFPETGDDMHEWDARRHEPSLDLIRTNLTAQNFEAAVTEDREWSIDQGVDRATTTTVGIRSGR